MHYAGAVKNKAFSWDPYNPAGGLWIKEISIYFFGGNKAQKQKIVIQDWEV